MIKKTLSFLLVISTSAFSVLNAQSWIWATQGKPISSSPYTIGEIWANHAVVSDNAGNVYAAGYFQDTIKVGSDTLKGPISGNTFFYKSDAGGNVKWVKQANSGGTYSAGYGIAMDKSGNIFVAGEFLGSVSFGTDTLFCSYYDAYIAKFDPNGNFMWLRGAVTKNPSSYCSATSVAVDDSGNAFLAGYYDDTVSFGSVMLGPAPYVNMFLVKYSPNGTVRWAKQNLDNNSHGEANGTSVAADASGNSIVTGYFSDTISFSGVKIYDGGMFLVKYDRNGNLLWVEHPTGTGYGTAQSVSLDKYGNAYVTGSFTGAVTFGSTNLYSSLGYNLLLCKYYSNGTVAWAEGGTAMDNNDYEGFAVYCDTTTAAGGFLVFSEYIYAIDIPPFKISFGGQIFSLNTTQTTATTILKFDSAGNSQCGTMFTEGGEDDWDGICVSPNGSYVYLGGDIDENVRFGPDSLIATGREMPMILSWRYCEDQEGTQEIRANSEEVRVYPDPSAGLFTVSLSNPEAIGGSPTITIYNMVGEQVYNSQLSAFNSQLSIDLLTQSSGIYLYRVSSSSGQLIGEGKLIIQK